MSITITQRPYRNIDINNTSIVSKWVCSNNPIVYIFSCIIGFPGSYPAFASYHIKVRVYEAGSNVLLGETIYKPLINGVDDSGYIGTVRADISSIVKPYLQNQYSFTSDTINQKDNKSTLKIYLKYFEEDSTGISSTADDSPNPLYITSSVKQIGDKFGQNMADFLLIPQANYNAKFLSCFKIPRFYPDYDYSISFLYSDKITGINVNRIQEYLDINQNLIGTETTILDPSQAVAVNMLRLNDSYNDNIGYVRLYLNTGNPITDRYVDSGYVNEGYVD